MPRKKKRIAVATEFYPLRKHYDLIHGVQKFAEAQDNWELDIGPYPEARKNFSKRFDGVVGRISAETLAAARAAGIPVVNTHIQSSTVEGVPHVLIDSYKAGRMAAEHLIARGLRRIVYISIRGSLANNENCKGVAAVAKEQGCACSRFYVNRIFWSSSLQQRQFVATLTKAAQDWQAPLGIATFEDHLGRSAVTEVQELGWSVPQDIAVISAGNDEIHCCNLFPTLSSIDLGYEQNGYEAARLLEELMLGKAPPEETILVPPKELVLRQTSDVFAVTDPRVSRALRFLADNSHCEISVGDVAAVAGINRQNLNRLFNRHIGHSINRELIRLRIEAFKRLLVESDMPLKKAGAQAGFGSESQVYRVFKRLNGMTPAEYREKRQLER
ncbi:MAG: substrate-binding domain-containing protein [Kiritimatiellia bacterium]|nr:substrate-binding domain-containing protein [Kiritimatiellia bacterium]